jgi:superfamily I DNA/RNA helicase
MDKAKWCWDDSRYNKAKPNEYFAFYFHGARVVIHKIENVQPPSCRLPSWSRNVGQGDRNVVELSEPLKEIGWTEWQLLNGPESKMGTYTTDDVESSRPLLYEMLTNIENKLENKNRNKNIKLIIEEENEEYDEEKLIEEEAKLLKQLKQIETLKKIKSYEKLKKMYIENIKELNDKILKIEQEIIALNNC